VARLVALSAFQQLGYTKTQAEILEAAAVSVAFATGLSLDEAEIAVRDLVQGIGCEPYRSQRAEAEEARIEGRYGTYDPEPWSGHIPTWPHA
jgi:hypothetical protein